MAPLVAGRYEVGDALGAGGNAEVVEAFDRHLERVVALKRVRTDAADPAAAERLTKEARVAARVVHPNVVQVLDAGVDADGRPFLVTERVSGACLAEVLGARGSFPVDEAVRIVSQVLDGLAAVHAQGIVHRDLKPANVLLADDGTAKIADFGIARDLGATTGLTATGQVIGTAAYLSPEQVEGHAATPRSDLYAVGVLLYELLTGSRPFDGSGAAVALAHRAATVPSVLDARPEVPAAVVAVVDAALAKDPADRPTDAAAMGAALASSVGAEATEVLPVARRRVPALTLAAAGGGLALIVGLLVGVLTHEDDITTSAGADSAVTTTAAPSTTVAALAPPPTAMPVTTTVAPTSERALELAARLDEVLAMDDEDEQAREAERLLRDIERWVERGELDPAVAQRAIGVLEPLADEHGHGSGEGRGESHGNDEGD